MKLIDYVNSQHPALKNFSPEELFKWYKRGMIYIDKGFTTPTELSEYIMQDGDKISVALLISTYREDNTIHVKYLQDNVDNISGLSDRIISNIESVLGDVFKVDELKDNKDNISGLGSKTLDNIINYTKTN